MRPTIALDLSLDGIALLSRAPDAEGGADGLWWRETTVDLETADLGAAMADLRARAVAIAGPDFVSMLVIPDSQLLYTSLDRDDRDPKVTIAHHLRDRTPYAVEDLAFDYHLRGDRLQVAVVALDTLLEAEAFAAEHGFRPVALTANPQTGVFRGCPDFGRTGLAPDLLRGARLDLMLDRGMRVVPRPDPGGDAEGNDATAHDDAVADLASEGAPDPSSEGPPERPPERPAEPETPVAIPGDAAFDGTPPIDADDADAPPRTASVPSRPDAAGDDPFEAAPRFAHRPRGEASAPDAAPRFASARRVEPASDAPRITPTLPTPRPTGSPTGHPPPAPPRRAEPRLTAVRLTEPDRPGLVGGPAAAMAAAAAAAKAADASDRRTPSADDTEPPVPTGYEVADAPAQPLRPGPAEADDTTFERIASALHVEAEPDGDAQDATEPATGPQDDAAGTAAASPVPASDGPIADEPIAPEAGTLADAPSPTEASDADDVRVEDDAAPEPDASTPPADDATADVEPDAGDRGSADVPPDDVASDEATAQADHPAPTATGSDEADGDGTDDDTRPVEAIEPADALGVLPIPPLAVPRPGGARDGARDGAPAIRTPRRPDFATPQPGAATQPKPRKAAGGRAGLGLVLTLMLLAALGLVGVLGVLLGGDDATDPAFAALRDEAGATAPAATPTPAPAPAPAPARDQTTPPTDRADDVAAERIAPLPRVDAVDRTAAVQAPVPITIAAAPTADAPAPTRADDDAAVRDAATDDDAATPTSDAPILSAEAPAALAPAQPEGADTPDEIVIAAIDPALDQGDAVRLPDAALPRLDLAPVTNPNPAGTSAPTGADGLVAATPEGSLAPGGYRVFAGTPPIATAPRPQTGDGPDTLRAQAEAEADAAKAILRRIRPQARPADAAEQVERASLGGLTRAELTRVRPRPRPATADARAPAPSLLEETSRAAAQAAAQAAAASLAASRAEASAPQGPVSELALPRSERPGTRPRSVERAASRIVTQRREQAAAPSASQPAATGGRQRIRAAGGDVARAATEQNQLRLNRINLIGTYGRPSSRRALVRLSNGRYVKVEVGDRLDRGRVTAIGDGELRYQRGGRNLVLRLPRA